MNEREFADTTFQIQNKLLAKIAKGDSLPEILNALIKAIEENLEQAFCSILLLDRDNHFHPGAAPSLPDEYGECASRCLITDTLDPCARAALRRETIITPDIAESTFEQDYQDLVLGYGLRACWSTPIFGSDDRVLGTFATYYQTVRSPQTHELKTIAQMAHLAGIAIERQQAEEQLRHSETMLLAAQKVAQVGNWAFDLASQTITWSPGMFCLYGLEPSAATPSYPEFLQKLTTEDRQRLQQCVERAAAQGLPYTIEHSIIRTDGTLRYHECRAEAERDADGKVTRLLGMTLDITERKQSELALQNLITGTAAITGKDFFPALARHITAALQVSYAIVSEYIDGQLHALAFCADGVMQPKLVYNPVKTPCELTLQAGRFYCERAVQQMFPDDLDLVEMGAESYLGIALKDSQGTSIGDLCILHQEEISNPNRTEQILQVFAARAAAEVERLRSDAASKRLLTVVEAAIDGISILQEDKYLYVNRAYLNLFGYEQADELIGKSWRQLYSPDEISRLEQDIMPQLTHNRAWQGEAIATRKDGSTFAQGVSLTLTEDNLLISVCRNISDLKQAQALITHNALHDPLTKLPNRTLLLERLDLAIERAQRLERYCYAVLFVDLDRFKVINDSLGHIVGDQLLIAIAQILKSHLRETDLVARLGGDEFLILLEDFLDTNEIVHIAEQILADCRTPLAVNDHQIFTSVSIGIVLGTSHYRQAGELIRDADIAMYRAKTQGSNSYKFFDAIMHIQALKRLTLEADLRKALEQEEFTVYYQPIVELSTQQLIGVEALVRWQHPVRGLVSPSEFIPIAEEIGLIISLDRWVFEQACQQMSDWYTQFSHGASIEEFSLKVSINLSAQDLRKANLIQDIDSILQKTGLPGSAITLEITESLLIKDIEQTIGLLTQLSDRQIQISIDDFGTGYSSLSYLHRLPVNNLKIDQSFVSQMQLESRNYQVVSTIVTLSNQLGLTNVAEGIETRQQLQYLQQLGCQFGQGYLFSKPLPAAEIEAQFLQTGTLQIDIL